MLEPIQALAKKLNFEIKTENGCRYFGPKRDSNCVFPVKGSEIFVGRIPFNAYEDQLYKLFSQAGAIFQIRLMLNIDGTTKGYCFVEYRTPFLALRAIAMFNGRPFYGKRLFADLSTDHCNLILWGCQVSQERLLETIRSEVKDDRLVIEAIAPATYLLQYSEHRFAQLTIKRLKPHQSQLWGPFADLHWQPNENVSRRLQAKKEYRRRSSSALSYDVRTSPPTGCFSSDSGFYRDGFKRTSPPQVGRFYWANSSHFANGAPHAASSTPTPSVFFDGDGFKRTSPPQVGASSWANSSYLANGAPHAASSTPTPSVFLDGDGFKRTSPPQVGASYRRNSSFFANGAPHAASSTPTPSVFFDDRETLPYTFTGLESANMAYQLPTTPQNRANFDIPPPGFPAPCKPTPDLLLTPLSDVYKKRSGYMETIPSTEYISLPSYLAAELATPPPINYIGNRPSPCFKPNHLLTTGQQPNYYEPNTSSGYALDFGYGASIDPLVQPSTSKGRAITKSKNEPSVQNACVTDFLKGIKSENNEKRIDDKLIEVYLDMRDNPETEADASHFLRFIIQMEANKNNADAKPKLESNEEEHVKNYMN